MMRYPLACCGVGCLVLAGCVSPTAEVQVGVVSLQAKGDVSLVSGTGGITTTASQDLESAFGLGDTEYSPYVRGQLDFSGSTLTASGFTFAEKGNGLLEANFGGLPAGVAVASSLEFTMVKLSYAFDFDLGPVRLSPGLALDVFDLDFTASSGGNSEVIDELVPVPMLFLRAEAGYGFARLAAEAGYLDTPDFASAEGSLLDFEAMLECQLLPTLHAFVGYRLIDLTATGESDLETFDVDMQVSGWMVGGGLRF